MTKTEHFSVKIANKIGEGARVLGALRDAGIDFTGVWGYQKNSRAALLELLPKDAKAFTKAAKKLGLDFSPALSALVYDGQDHPGAVAESLQKLADAGISVLAVQALCGGEGRYGAAVMVAKADARKAAKALGA